MVERPSASDASASNLQDLQWTRGGVGSRRRFFAPDGYSAFDARDPDKVRVFRYGVFVGEIPTPQV